MHSLYVYITSHTAGPGARPETPAATPKPERAWEAFGKHLDEALAPAEPQTTAGELKLLLPEGDAPPVYGKGSKKSISEQIRIYKEDQLLAHPGGDNMDLTAQDPALAPESGRGFWERVQKDLGDAWENIKNLFKDLFFGSSFRYVDDKGAVETAERRGLVGRVVKMVEDLAGGLSLGLLRWEGEEEPEGLKARLLYSAKKIFGDVLRDGLVFGLPQVGLNLADDATLAAWNLAETVPDMTIGSMPNGAAFVSDMFDNGQVMLDFATDCLPAGEAWMRVHAYRLGLEENGVVPPVLFNLKLPVHYLEDETWATVRNTDFRKSIETVGSIIPDIGASMFTQYAIRTSKRK
jgi:hypothetical protein